MPWETRHTMHIALFVQDLGGSGGAERVMLNLGCGLLGRVDRLDLVMARRQGHYLDLIPPGMNVVDLGVRGPWQGLGALPRLGRDAPAWLRLLIMRRAEPVLGALPGLAYYLRRHRPQALVSALDYPNFVALLARDLARAPTRVVVTEHNTLSVAVANASRSKSRVRARPALARRFYPRADAVVAVSKGVASDLTKAVGLDMPVRTIHNPVVSPYLLQCAAESPQHPWFREAGRPLILAVGGLNRQKDFWTLLRAFARLREAIPARLVILGEGKQRSSLEALAGELGIRDHLDMPGFVRNPYSHMASASLLTMSSVWEGLPTVLIEALACGCPVVSTDCPSGPREILEDGRHGRLVPVGDADALAGAMVETMRQPPERQALRAHGARFSIERSSDAYLELIRALIGRAGVSGPVPASG